MRSVASSRVRWATVIDSVLKMTNAPTNRAIAAEREQEVLDEFVNSDDLVAVVARLLDAASARHVAGSDAGSIPHELFRRHAVGLAATWIASNALLVEEAPAPSACRRPRTSRRRATRRRRTGRCRRRLKARPGRATRPDRVADAVVLVVGRARVDDDLVRAGGQRPSIRLSGLKRVASGRVEAEAESRRALAADRLAVAVEDLRRGLVDDDARWRPRPRRPADLLEQRRRHRRRLRVSPWKRCPAPCR